MTGCASEDAEVDKLGEEEDEEPPELYSGDVSSAVKRRGHTQSGPECHNRLLIEPQLTSHSDKTYWRQCHCATPDWPQLHSATMQCYTRLAQCDSARQGQDSLQFAALAAM